MLSIRFTCSALLIAMNFHLYYIVSMNPMRLVFPAILLACLLLCATVPPALQLQEESVRAAMLDEILERIENRHRGEREQYDYLTVQAHDAVRELLPRRSRRMPPLRETLLELYRGANGLSAPEEFRQAVDFFVQGMSGEIFDSLSYEFDEAEQKVQCLLRVVQEIQRRKEISPELIVENLRVYGLSARSLQRSLQAAGPSAASTEHGSSFARYQALKQSVFGIKPYDGLALIFDLGDKHRSISSFNEEFFTQYSGLAERYLELCRQLNSLLEASRK